MSIDSQPILPYSTEFALLGFLKQGPRHGYDIYRELAEPGGLWLVWRMKQSQLYALLARLEEHGFLASFKGESRPGRPPRKMYSLTPSGLQAFRDWLQAPVERGRQFRLDMLIKLFFLRREKAAPYWKNFSTRKGASAKRGCTTLSRTKWVKTIRTGASYTAIGPDRFEPCSTGSTRARTNSCSRQAPFDLNINV